MICPPVRGDNPLALASVYKDKHGVTILYLARWQITEFSNLPPYLAHSEMRRV